MMKGMDVRGQVSVEYLLVVLVLILVLSLVTVPLIGQSLDASSDVSSASDAKIAVENIANAADVVYANGPGAKRTLTVYIPQTTQLVTFNNTVGLNITYSNGTAGIINTTTQYPVANNTFAVSEGWHTVVVTWQLNNNYVSYTIT